MNPAVTASKHASAAHAAGSRLVLNAEGKGTGEFSDPLQPARLAVVPRQDMILARRNEREPLGGLAPGPRRPVEAMQQIAGDAVLLQHHGNGLSRVEGRVTLAAALRVNRQRLLELFGKTEVIRHKPAGLVAEDAVHPRNGLHDLEWVLGVLELIRQLPPLLVADVLLPFGAVLGAAVYHDFHHERLASSAFRSNGKPLILVVIVEEHPVLNGDGTVLV